MRKHTTICLLILIFLSACQTPRYIYSPSAPNNPFLTEKGESKLSASISGGNRRTFDPGGKNGGFDIQGAYAITDKWAVTAGYSYRKEKDIYDHARYNFFDSSVINYKRKLVEFGAGMFLPLDKEKKCYFTFYSGLGFGKFSFVDNGIEDPGIFYNRNHKSNVFKFYFQPAFNFIPGEYFRLSVGGRCSFVNYSGITTSYTAPEIDYYGLDVLSRKALFNFLEPMLQIQCGIPQCDWLKIDGSAVFTGNITHTSKMKSRWLNVSIGLSFDLSKLKKQGTTSR